MFRSVARLLLAPAFLVLLAPAARAQLQFDNSTSIAIPAAGTAGPANPYPSQISVIGVSNLIGKVTVRLNSLTHTFPDDLDFLLVGPAGQSCILMSDCGNGDGVSGVTLTFDDAAASSLPDATQITSGMYRPSNYVGSDGAVDVWPAPVPAGPYGGSLGVFNFTNPNGVWRLFINDDLGGDVGTLALGWTLFINEAAPVPQVRSNPTLITINDAAAATPYPSTITVSGLADRIDSVTVNLFNVSHTYPDDIDMLLVGPNGQSCILMSDCGEGFDIVGINLTFDDAAGPMPDFTQIFAATYRPTNYLGGDVWPAPAPIGPYGAALSVFKNADPNGTWSLYVVDDEGIDVGSIAGGWSITINQRLFCPGDYDHNGRVEPADVARFVADWFAGVQSGCPL